VGRKAQRAACLLRCGSWQLENNSNNRFSQALIVPAEHWPVSFRERGWVGKRIRRADTRIICRVTAKRYQRPKPNPSQVLPPIQHQTRELPELTNITQYVYVAVAARHGVTASRFPGPRISRQKKNKKTFFHPSSLPRLPASLSLGPLSFWRPFRFVSY
jgi:hypothetical protein